MAFLILVIGDLHIPDRALDIPAKVCHAFMDMRRQHQLTQVLFACKQFKKLLAPGKIGQTLCLGNLTDKTTYEYLRTISPDLKIVRGRMDVEATSLPLTQVVTHGSVRVGFLEGFTLVSNEPDLLLAEANKLDVDVLCWGGTHKFECFEYMDKFFVNPGSATGAFTTSQTDDEEPTPSFCLMDVRLPPPFLDGVGKERKGSCMCLCVFGLLLTASCCAAGTRDLLNTICIPVKERCQWC